MSRKYGTPCLYDVYYIWVIYSNIVHIPSLITELVYCFITSAYFVKFRDICKLGFSSGCLGEPVHLK